MSSPTGVQRQRALVWMGVRAGSGECDDPTTGEVCATTLAEQYADEHDTYEGEDCTIPEWVFEASAVVASRIDARRARHPKS